MVYKVHVTKAIWADEECTTLFDHLYYDLELPFVPFIGLKLQQAGWYCDALEQVSWDGDNHCFRVESHGHVPEELGEGPNAENRRRMDLEAGWKSHQGEVAGAPRASTLIRL
jgi:hypothetical protein